MQQEPAAGDSVRIAIAGRSALGAPAILAVTGHQAVTRVILSRDFGDQAGQNPALRAVPCLLLEFVSASAADEALTRLRAITARFTFKESPTRISCSNGVRYTLRVVRGFDEATIAAIEAHYQESAACYVAAQHERPRRSTRHGRR